MSQDAYARAARLIYIVCSLADGPRPALIQAHRLAASAVAAHPGDDEAAVRQALRSSFDAPGRWRTGWRLLAGPRLTPVEVTTAQRRVLNRIKAVDRRVAAAAVLHILDGIETADLAAVVRPEDPERGEGSVRQAVARICDGFEPAEITGLLLGRELDPVVVAVSAQAVLNRRRRRIRVGSAATAAAVALAAVGGWWFGVRTQVSPLGSRANDPQIQVQSLIGHTDYGVNAWPARGELLGDTALLRRAADGWRARGLASAARPHVVFAGRVNDVSIVVMTAEYTPTADAMSVGVYAEGLRGKLLDRGYADDVDTRVLANPYGVLDPLGPGGIRLLDAATFRFDPILLPPAASEVETGPLDTPTEGWRPARPDARGVIEVPEPPTPPTPPGQQHARDWSPSSGIRFKEPDQNIVAESPVIVPEGFYDSSPLLPAVASAGSAHPVLSAADWCALRTQAERADAADDIGYSDERIADVADGPLPDGGGTGYVIQRSGTGPQHDMFTDAAVLSTPGPGCASATLQGGRDMASYAVNGSSELVTSFVSGVTAAVLWTSPSNHSYLVVAAGAPDVARVRVSGPVSASANGRWLVVPFRRIADRGELAEQPLVEAFDAAGHRCGDPDPQVADKYYCGGS